jgi:hypothetical protein
VATICIQFHPERAAKLKIHEIVTLATRVGFSVSGVASLTVQRGRSAAYFNLLFTARSTSALWKALDSKLLHNPRVGATLRLATIVTATGSRGWANYRLLHHFSERADPF